MHNNKLSELVKKYNISNEDLLALSKIEQQKKEANFFNKEKLKKESIGVLKKYKVKFLDLGNLINAVAKQQITATNIQDVLLGDTVKEVEDSKEKLSREDDFEKKVVTGQGKNEAQKSTSNLFKCPDCGKDVSKTAKVCPNCGNKKLKKQIADQNWAEMEPKKKYLIYGVVALVIILFFYSPFGGGSEYKNGVGTITHYTADDWD